MGILDSSKTLVYELINKDNPNLPTLLTPANCSLDKIKSVPPSADNGYRNTSVRVRGLQGEGYNDQFTLYYDRLKLSTVIMPAVSGQREESKFVTFSSRTIHQALEIISTTYGINFQTGDVADAALPSAEVPNATALVTLTATPTCPAYTGNVRIKMARGKPLLETAITSNVLNPCKHPIQLSEKMCVDMLTYGLDFTAYRSVLTVNAGGLPHWTELRTILDFLGVPSYASPETNTIIDAATSTTAGTNTAFDRVVMHSAIDEAGIKGTAYYHYNV